MALGGAMCLMALSVAAQTPQPGAADVQSGPVSVRWSLKGGALFSGQPDVPALFAEGASATAFGRARVEPTIRLGDDASFEMAYEQRARISSSAQTGLVTGALPPVTPAPYRLAQLDWQIAAGAQGFWRQEIDRAALRWRASALTVTAGRQAVGWGRGVVFSAVDLFAPFSPLEADREWRRGVDALSASTRLGARASLDGVAAFGRHLASDSAVAVRVRGYAGDVDVEAVGGRRGRDVFGGLASSAAVGAAEVHGELAVFGTPAVAGSTSFADPRTIVKAVAGGSARAPVGSGLLVYVEYHYSGFGARSAAEIPQLLADPAFATRYLRGDTQILTRHAVAVLASYEQSPLTSFSATWIQQPVDHSGVVSPAITLTFGDRLSLVVTGYVSYGRGASDLTPESEYGATPASLYVEARYYR
jgi:hypothetical protein